MDGLSRLWIGTLDQFETDMGIIRASFFTLHEVSHEKWLIMAYYGLLWHHFLGGGFIFVSKNHHVVFHFFRHLFNFYPEPWGNK